MKKLNQFEMCPFASKYHEKTYLKECSITVPLKQTHIINLQEEI